MGVIFCLLLKIEKCINLIWCIPIENSSPLSPLCYTGMKFGSSLLCRNNNESFLSTRSFLMMKSELLYQTFWTLAGQAETSEHFSKMFAHQKKGNAIFRWLRWTYYSFLNSVQNQNYCRKYCTQIDAMHRNLAVLNQLW